jgi:3-hydroxyacyl-[acyl-carrier-protein] dehydratase
MLDAGSSSSVSSKPFATTPKSFAPEDEAALREALKRCSPSTFEAAVQFRKTGNPEHVPAVSSE